MQTAPDPSEVVLCRAPRSYLALKARLDQWAAACAIAASWPLLLTLAWLVRRDSPGPAVFRQIRAGRTAKPFPMFKFRTMRTDVNPYGDSPTTGDDPRITPLGKRLRETSLDELPQLFNVLLGQMSLVGPRPLFVQQIAGWTPRQRSRLQVRPGLTGFSQIHGRASLTIEDKLEWDVRYVQAVSFKTDLWVIWRTVESVLMKRGLYQTRYSQARDSFA